MQSLELDCHFQSGERCGAANTRGREWLPGAVRSTKLEHRFQPRSVENRRGSNGRSRPMNCRCHRTIRDFWDHDTEFPDQAYTRWT
jgi:hypothetical protein